MKTSLDHLPEPKREQLQRIADMIRGAADVDKVILFGSYARNDWVEDFETHYFSDYDILVVVKELGLANKLSLWARVEQEVNELTGRIPVTLLVHDIKQINQEIRRGRYFYTDVLQEGIALFDAERFMLAKPRSMSPGARLESARYDFRYWFQSASGFWYGVSYFKNTRELAHAAFLLHQSAERYYHAALLVHTGYKPRLHNLSKLAEQAAEQDARLTNALPAGEGYDKHLFDLLKRAYIEARYSKTYTITVEELTELRRRVRGLAELVLESCREKLGTFVSPEAVGTLPDVPEVHGSHELPPPPKTDDADAIDAWGKQVVFLIAAKSRADAMEEGRQEGLTEGKQEGIREGKADVTVKLIEARFGPLPAAVSEGIKQSGVEELDRLALRVLDAATVDDLFD